MKIHGVIAVLIRSDGTLVLQRRDGDAPRNAHLLTFFGGHMEENEKPLQCVKRELSEETSLKISELKFKKISVETVAIAAQSIALCVFVVSIPTEDFEVYEGTGAEAYSLKEALQRNDIAQADMQILQKLDKLIMSQ
jgi:8-oxo-dGTP pyrophosphatase MutT (NUDIX family)